MEATLVRPSRSHLPLALRPFPLRQIPLTAARNKARTRRTTQRRRASPTARSRAQLCPRRSRHPFLTTPRRADATTRNKGGMQRRSVYACESVPIPSPRVVGNDAAMRSARMRREGMQVQHTTRQRTYHRTCGDASNMQRCSMQHATIQQYTSPIQSHEGSGWPCTKTGLSGTRLVGNAPKRNRV